MQKAVLFLFLASRVQALSGPPPSEPHFPTQENFSQDRFMGKWYDVAVASTCPWLQSHKGHLTAGTLELKPGDSSDTIKLTRTAIRDGTCKQKSMIYGLSQVPGRFSYHSTKWAADVHSYVVRTNYDEYAIVALTKQRKGQNWTTSLKLYGRSAELHRSLLGHFTQLVKEQGMSEDDIVVLKNTGECVLGEAAPEPEIQRARRNAEEVATDDTVTLGNDSCLSLPDSGPCSGWFHRFYYNSTVKACQQFTYGGCEGNQNNFLTEKACLQRCRSKDACSLPILIGPCRAYIPRWAFDSKTGKCAFFIYGGCEGNDNNFYSLQECEEHCDVKDIMLRLIHYGPGATSAAPTLSYCHDAPDTGPCDASFQHFYYNPVLMTCQNFTYGGCQGNKNNFQTEDACLQSCRTKASCKLPTVTGPCKAYVPRWAFNSSSGKCVPFTYGGCRGNGNNFYSQSECQDVCEVQEDPCMSPPDTGPCEAYIPRYYYNSTLMACMEFIYGGCLGNQNNFVTEQGCQQTCKTVAPCRMPIVTGPCQESLPHWAFNPVKGECVPFIYGGCQGNSNNFATKKDCEDLCGLITDPCTSPPDTGPCDGSFPRFYYNSSHGACENFTYGGCQGNKNNFFTEMACLNSCRTPAICRLPIVTGPCKAAFQRWAFVRGKCVRFIYGGCSGNGNNFNGKKECEEYCSVMEERERTESKGDEEVMEVS